MHYTPDAERAFNSVEHIMRDVNSGWLIRYLHSNGASMFFLAVYIHMFRGLYYGSYKAPRELIWIIGVLLYALMILTAFLGYTLPWGQMSFWAATVITSLFSAIPGVGEPIVHWLWGGFGVDNPTLNRFFSLHYLLPFILVGRGRPAHLGAARAGQQQPARHRREEPARYGSLPSLLHGEGLLLSRLLPDPVRVLRVLRAGDVEQPGQLPSAPIRS